MCKVERTGEPGGAKEGSRARREGLAQTVTQNLVFVLLGGLGVVQAHSRG